MGTLSATGIKSLKEAGRYGDGDGLFLIVKPSGRKSWMVRAQKNGTRRDIGLGSEAKVTLAEARKRAAIVRAQIEVGLDPVSERKKAAGIPTFREAAATVHAENKKSWRNGKHNAQWLSSLEAYAFPYIGDLTVNEIEAPNIRDLLAPIWLEKHETAKRVRQRIGNILDWAHSKGFRPSEAPMNAINKGLPKYKAKVNHHKALPYKAVPAFVTKIKNENAWGTMALQFAILTAARSGEVRGAVWQEIDMENALWTIPAERMKAEAEHIVPLSDAAIALLQRAQMQKSYKQASIVFEGAKPNHPMSDATMAKALRVAGGGDATVHGFRSSFRDWASEETQFSNEVCESALAHTIANKTEAAYRRGNLLDKRRGLMSAWSDYLNGSNANLIHLARFNHD